MTIPNQIHFSFVAQLSPALKAESVVAMAVYHGDRADWVSHAIDSILDQSYSDFIFFIAIDGDICHDLSILVHHIVFVSKMTVGASLGTLGEMG